MTELFLLGVFPKHKKTVLKSHSRYECSGGAHLVLHSQSASTIGYVIFSGAHLVLHSQSASTIGYVIFNQAHGYLSSNKPVTVL